MQIKPLWPDLINKEKLILEYQLVEREERLRNLEVQYHALETQVKQVCAGQGTTERQADWFLTSASNEQHSPPLFTPHQGHTLRHGSIPDASTPLLFRRTMGCAAGAGGGSTSSTGAPRSLLNGTTVNLCESGLNVKRLGVVVKQCRLLKKPIEVLRLSMNNLEDDSAPLLSEVINIASKSLASIDLSHNSLGPKTVSSLLSLLKNNRNLAENLQCLILNGNCGMGAVPGLGSTFGRELKESYSKGGLRKLWCLSLTLNDFKGVATTSAPVEKTPTNPTSRTTTTAAAAAAMKKTPAKVVKVKDPMNAMSFVSTLRDKSKPPLLSLELTNARLSQKTMGLLARTDCLTSLTHLNLQDAQIGPLGVQALCFAINKQKDCIRLISLHLRGNLIGDYGAEVLGKSLAEHAAVTDLDLTRNNLTDNGAMKISQHLVPGGVLVSLKLAKNRLTGAAIKRLIKLSHLPHVSLASVDLSGQPLPVTLKYALEKELKGRHELLDGSNNNTHKTLVEWKKGTLFREPFSSALMDGYIKVWTYELPHDAFDFPNHHHDDPSLQPTSNISNIISMTWRCARSCSDPDHKYGASRFLWKLMRERHGDLVVVQSGRSENHIGVHKSRSLGVTFLKFRAVVPDCLPEDKFILSVAAADQHYIVLPKLSLADAGQVLCRKVSAQASVDDKYGMIYEKVVITPPAGLPDYDESRAMTVTSKDENEAWKLITLYGDGEFMRLHDLLIGVGGHVRLAWEGRVEDREDGAVVLPFVWAVMRRSLGVSTIIAHGRVKEDQQSSKGGKNLEGWVPQEVVVNFCVPGDVLVLWMGVLKQKEDGWSHLYTPMARNIRLFRERLVDDVRGGKQQGVEGNMATAVCFASGYPCMTIGRPWGY